MQSAFFPWDPMRPLATHPCAHCSKAGASSRCSRCRVARYCSKDCQSAHHGAHKGLCKLGLEGYKNRVLQHLQALAGFMKLGGVEGEKASLAEYEVELEEARRMGDAEGERHLCKVLAHRLAGGGEGGRERAAALEGRAKVLEDMIGGAPGPGGPGGIGKDLERLLGGVGGAPGGLGIPPPEELRKLLAGELKLLPMGI